RHSPSKAPECGHAFPANELQSYGVHSSRKLDGARSFQSKDSNSRPAPRFLQRRSPCLDNRCASMLWRRRRVRRDVRYERRSARRSWLTERPSAAHEEENKNVLPRLLGEKPAGRAESYIFAL